MAWSSAALAANPAHADDKPCFLVNPTIPTSIIAEDNGTNDVTDARFPIEYIVDGIPIVYTTLTPVGVASWIQVQFYFANYVSFNTIALIKQNLGTIGDITLQVIVADDAALTTNVSTIHSKAMGDDLRYINYFNAQYSTQHIAFRFVKSTNFAVSDIIRLGHIFIGNKYTMARRPNEPVSFDKAVSRGIVTESPYGAEYVYSQGPGLKELHFTWNPGVDDTGSYAVAYDDSVTLDALYVDTKGYTKPFGWAPNPITKSQKFLWVRSMDMTHDIQHIEGPYKEVELTLTEIGPAYDAELNGW